jgi:dienelactone hydrolase
MTWNIRSAVFMVGVLALCSTVNAQERIPVEHFATGESMISPALSPSGRHLVYITHTNGKPFVMAYDLATQAIKGILSGESNNFTVRWCGFKNDERVLCSFRAQEYEAGRPYTVTRLVALNIDGKQIRVLLQNDEENNAQFQDEILHWLPDDPRNVLMELDDDGDIYPSVFRIDVYSGSKRLVQPQRQPVVSWMADRAGVVRFGYGYRNAETSGFYTARTSESAQWKTIEKFDRYHDDTFTPLGFGVRPNTLLVRAAHDRRSAVWEFDLEGSKEAQLVFSNDQVDVDGTIDWPSDGHVTGFSYHTDKPQAHYIDDLARRVEVTMRKMLPDRFTRIVDASRDGKRLVIAAYSDVKPTSYYLLDIDAGSFVYLSSENPALDKATLSSMQPITIPFEGVNIPGYLTLPVGKHPRNLPAVVLPHGGPYTRDTWGFDPMVQLLANRGYAVLQLNFRGSSGYGEKWLSLGWRGWGTVIHGDITAGARWLVKEGIADPRRLCIVGGSYGGYAALLGVVKEPGLYRCAASIAGVSDLNELKSQDRFFYGGYVAARESIGEKKAELRDVSPLRYADRIKVPVLLVHGEADSTVLASHSTSMAKELRKNRVPNDLVIIEDADHHFRRESMRLTLYRKLEAFLAANLQADPGT